MEFIKYLKEENIVFLSSTRKNNAIEGMLDHVHQKYPELNIKDLKDSIIRRESLMSTGIGLGIGIPHLRHASITEPIIVFGIQPEGIKNYESIDKFPVKLVVLILVGKDQHKEYLQLLSSVVKFLKHKDSLNSIFKFSEAEQVFQFLKKGK